MVFRFGFYHFIILLRTNLHFSYLIRNRVAWLYGHHPMLLTKFSVFLTIYVIPSHPFIAQMQGAMRHPGHTPHAHHSFTKPIGTHVPASSA
jgi:hypothetical protein